VPAHPPPGSDDQPAAIVAACGNGAFGQLGATNANVKKSLVPVVVPLPAELTTTSIVSGPPSLVGTNPSSAAAAAVIDGGSGGAPIVTLTTTSSDRIVDIHTSYFFNVSRTIRLCFCI
jgi:hypothetical protein